MSVRLSACLADFAERGITADKLTADEIEALVLACARVDNPYSDVNAELCGRPVEVCKGLHLWPLTAGAHIWLTEYAERWWPRGSSMFRWAQVYALRHARDKDAFAALTTRGKARAAILKCMLRFCCHRAELAVAVNRCYGVHEGDVESAAPEKPDTGMAADFAVLAATLEVRSGIKADHWLWGRSLMLMVKDYQRLRVLSNALGGGKELEFELDAAIENLARVKSAILANHRAG